MTKPDRLTASWFTVLLLLAARASAAVGPEIVWQPTPQAVQAMREACSDSAPAKYGDCLIAQMAAAGASPAAVAFTRNLQDQMGQIAYARGLRAMGSVDVVFIDYLLRANENQGWLLVNGKPPLLDVDDLQRLPLQQMRDDPAYAALAARHPRVTLFPGDRIASEAPEVERLLNGGQRFVIRYRLLDGCHACARLGAARFAFDFDETGRWFDTRFVGIDDGS